MGTQNTQMELSLRLADAERRLHELESRLLGKSRGPKEPDTLLHLYLEAAKGARVVDAQAALLWAAVIEQLGTVDLLVLGRLTRDPFPYLPFLRILESGIRDGYDLGVAHQRLVAAAEALLRAQGLGKLRVADVRHTPSAIHRAFSAISRRKEAHGYVQHQ